MGVWLVWGWCTHSLVLCHVMILGGEVGGRLAGRREGNEYLLLFTMLATEGA